MNQVIGNAVGTAFLVYIVLGTVGYMTFGPKVLPNLIMMYQSGLIVLLGRELLVLLQLFSFPLQLHPCRACLEQILPGSIQNAANREVFSAEAPVQYTRIYHHEHDNERGSISRPFEDSEVDSEIEVQSHSPTILTHTRNASVHRSISFEQKSPRHIHVILTTSILVLSYLVAITVSKLDLVLAFVGATGSTTISFILPGAFYYGLHRNQPWHWRKILAAALAIFGVIMMVTCLSANLIGLVESAKGGKDGIYHGDGPGGM